MPTKTSVRTNSRSKVVSLQHKDLTDIPGKEGLMVAVEIAPGVKGGVKGDHWGGAKGDQ